MAPSRTISQTAQENQWELMLLFGSQARYEAGPESDYDVAILAGRHGTRSTVGLCEALGQGNLDVVWLDDASWLLWKEVSRDGKMLYERTPNLVQEFRIEALLRSWDSDVWRERNRAFVARALQGSLLVNRDLVERKLAMLTQYLMEIRPILELPQERFLHDPMVHHAAERLVELLVECASTINTEISQSVAGIPPSDYYSSFFSMASAGWLDPETARALAEWARIRNTLVHRYESLDLEDLHRQLMGCLPHWSAYLEAVQAGLKRL